MLSASVERRAAFPDDAGETGGMSRPRPAARRGGRPDRLEGSAANRRRRAPLPVRYGVFVDEPTSDGARFVEQEPVGASVHECVEGGLARAGQVIVRMGEAVFLAGSLHDPGEEGLNDWLPSPAMRARVRSERSRRWPPASQPVG